MTKKILKLAIPSIIENTLQTSVGFIDTLMISSIGLAAVTGIGTANSIISIFLAIYVAIGIGASSLVSRKLGANDNLSASKSASKGLVLLLLVSLLFTITSLFFSTPLLRLMGLDNEYLKLGQTFLVVVGSFSFTIGLSTYFGSILRAQGNTKTPMYVGLLINIINILIDYCLIFGFLFIPPLGVLGTAIGTVISRIIGSIILYIYVQKSNVKISFKNINKDYDYKEINQLTIPSALERLAMRFGQVVYFGLIIFISEETFAAHNITAQIEGFTYMPALGLASAASTLVGFSIGQKKYNDAKKYGLKSVYIGIISMSLLGIVEYIFAPFFASIFTDEQHIIDMIVIALRTNAIFQPAVATSLIITGALQGMGDTKSPLISTLLGMWLLRVLGVYFFGIVLNLGIMGVWLSIGIDLTIRAIIMLVKYRLNFKSKKFIQEVTYEK